MTTTRREALGALLGAGASVGTIATAQGGASPSSQPAAPGCVGDWSRLRWGSGFEGQRKPDLGDGTFLNPLVSGDHPDPSILRDGDNYYLTFSSFDAYPGIVIWHSRDLVNWRPVTAALSKPIGSVWAPELVKHDGRFYVYIPARFPDYRSIYVIHAERIEGPWSWITAIGIRRGLRDGVFAFDGVQTGGVRIDFRERVPLLRVFKTPALYVTVEDLEGLAAALQDRGIPGEDARKP